MLQRRKLMVPMLALLVLSVFSAAPAKADDITVLEFSICGGPSAPPTPESFPFPGAIAGVIGCDTPEGTYTETLTALVDRSGMPIGTLGVATFDFGDGNTITTQNLSLITGASEDGSTLFVNSIGIVTGATGNFAGVSGGFLSSSEVNALTFQFTTDVDMVLFDD